MRRTLLKCVPRLSGPRDKRVLVVVQSDVHIPTTRSNAKLVYQRVKHDNIKFRQSEAQLLKLRELHLDSWAIHFSQFPLLYAHVLLNVVR